MQRCSGLRGRDVRDIPIEHARPFHAVENSHEAVRVTNVTNTKYLTNLTFFTRDPTAVLVAQL